MNIIRRGQTQNEMDLVQITDADSRHPGRRVVFELLLAIALSVGCWYTFFSMFANPVDPMVNAVLIAALPVGLYLLCWTPFLGRFLFWCVLFLTLLFCLIVHKDVWNGFLVMGNAVIEVLNKQMGAGIAPFHTVGDSVDGSRDAFVAMLPTVLLASMAIVHSIYHKEPLLGFIFTGLPVIAGLWLGAAPSIWLLLLLLLCWTGLFVLSAVARPVSRKKNRPIYIQNEKNSSLPYIFLSCSLVVLLGYVLIFSGDDYKPPESVDEAKAAAIEMQEHMRYDNLTGEKIDTLSQGNLKKTHPLEYTGNTVMTVNMQQPQAMYLRGFTGGSFQKGKWSPVADKAHAGQIAKTSEQLARQGFYPWMQQGLLYQMSGNSQLISVNVSNTNGSSKYLYMHYEAALAEDALQTHVDYEKDYGAFAKGLRGQREYSFQTFVPRFQDYDETGLANWLAELKQSPDWSSYADAEDIYRQYVQAAYLHVSKKDAASLGTTGIDRCQGTSIEYTLNYIRKNFSDEFTYNPKKKAVSDGKDELYEFLNVSRSGNDMHFATAAALMFRQAGIPARYAEGYYLQPKEMDRYLPQKEASVDVRDSQAHSWVEVYVDEIGWFPVEVVPGFYSLASLQDGDLGDGSDGSEEKKIYRDKTLEEEKRLEQQNQKNSQEKTSGLLWLLLALAVVLAAAALYEWLGRRYVKRQMAAFAEDHSQEQVYAMYRYLGRLLAFDKHPLPANPYDQLEELAELYDKAAGEQIDAPQGTHDREISVKEILGKTHEQEISVKGILAKEEPCSFEEFLRLVHCVRFGGGSLTPEEHRKLADYVQNAAKHVYNRQNQVGKFLMKFILFYI